MTDPNPDAVWDALPQERLAAHLIGGSENQSAFARRCGVPQPALSKWLRGRGTLTPEQLASVVAALPADAPPDDERRSPAEPAAAPAAPVPATLTHAEIHPSPLNPRKTFDADQLAALAESIAERGLLQNLVVRRDGERWVLVAGERRWRAIGLLRDAYRWADNDPIPVRVVDADEIDARLIALLENVQRADVDPLEEARAFAELVDLGVDTAAIAAKISRSRRHVQLRLQLLRLDDGVAASLAAGEISLAAARAVAHLPPKAQLAFVKRATENEWTGDQLARRARAGWVEADKAGFDVAASGLEVFEEADGSRWILDGKAFAEHQKAEAERRADAYRAAGWRKVEVVSYFGAYAYLDGRTSDPAAGDVVIEVSWQHVITEHVGLVARFDLVRNDEEPTLEQKAARAAASAARKRNDERLNAAGAAAVAAFRTAPPEIVLAAVLTASACDWQNQPGCSDLSDFDDPLEPVESDDSTWPSFEELVPGFAAARDAGAAELLCLLSQQPLSLLLLLRLLAIGAAGCNLRHPPGEALAALLGVQLPELEEVPS